jgi:iron(III) transport system substrate-binding protein
MKKWIATAVLGACVLAMPGAAFAQRQKITVYTALENDLLPSFKASIEKAVPEAEVSWVRDSTGVITARFLAEKDSPKADVIIGLAASSLLMFDKAGLLETYEPKGAANLKPAFRPAKAPYTWTGTAAYLGVVCYNTVEAKGVPVPQSWYDLHNPAFKGKIVMPHPASSGTGYLMVAGWLQGMGEEAGWKFMDGLHENIGAYLHSGSAPCVQAARGERTIGLALDMRGASEKTKGAPIEVLIPKEGVGWEVEASAVVKGTKLAPIARKIADWTASKEASELYTKGYAIVAYPGIEAAPKNYPANAEARMAKNDLGWMGENRERVLAEWIKRYDSKSAPKN